MATTIDAAVRECMSKLDALIEQACEEALQSGTKGVAVIRVDETTHRAGATDMVPYGNVYWFDTPEAWTNYLARM
jgi:hypothetical protein